MSSAAENRKSRDEGLALLRQPFPNNQIDHLPKPLSRDDKVRGKCEDTPEGRKFSADRIYCGTSHTRSVHLSYVGHAALTMRLLDADPEWDWEPLAFDEHGLPALTRGGGLWIKLTVQGVTRLGYGDAPGKNTDQAMKEIIGDALRNAGMRFGAALDLWSKSDLHAKSEEEVGQEWVLQAKAAPTVEDVRKVWNEARADGAPVAVLDAIAAVGVDLAAKLEGNAGA